MKRNFARKKKENFFNNIDEKIKLCACCGEKIFKIRDEENRKLFKLNFSDNDIGWICLECGNIEKINCARIEFLPLK